MIDIELTKEDSVGAGTAVQTRIGNQEQLEASESVDAEKRW